MKKEIYLWRKVFKKVSLSGKKIYVAAPYSGDVKKNIERAKMYAKILQNFECYPFVPHIAFSFMPETNETERKIIFDHCFKWIDSCDYLFVFGLSDGVKKEIEYAEKIGKPVWYFCRYNLSHKNKIKI